jgi:hypothetical protein
MARQICNGCGGYVGLDCFNPQECEWIAMDMQRIQRQNEEDRLSRIEEENRLLRQELNEMKKERHGKI